MGFPDSFREVIAMPVFAFIIGTMPMGRIDRVANCSVMTHFRMLNGIPLYALETCLDISGQLVPIPRNGRSIAAGFLRPWMTITAVLSLILVLVHPFFVIVPFALAVVAGYFWILFGQLSASEKRIRLAYATWLGAPFDPALLAAEWPAPCLEPLCAFVDERAVHAPVGYRATVQEPWRLVAAESTDPEFLIAALTRARFARRGASKSAQKVLDVLHGAIWAKLEPMLLAGPVPQPFLDWQQHLVQEEKRAIVVSPRAVIVAIAALGAISVASIPAVKYFLQPRVAIVNATAANGLTVLLDGKPVAKRIPLAARENDDGFVMTRIPSGEHEFVAQDATGREVDRQKFVLDAHKHNGLLYAPAREQDVCFYHERVTYSQTRSLQDYDLVKLDMGKSLHLFGMRIEHWFGPAPNSIKSSGQSAMTEQFTLRALPCDAKVKR